MSRTTTGDNTVDGGVLLQEAPATAVPELPATPQRLAGVAQDVLNWRGIALPPLRLLGRRVMPVVELIPDAHAERVCLGAEPVTDRSEVATWVWPERADSVPPPAVRLHGVLAPSRHWRSALTAAVPFARFTGAALVLPKAAADSGDFVAGCLMRARQFGVAVLTADEEGVEQELPGRLTVDGPPEHGAISRWVNEVLYQRILDTE